MTPAKLKQARSNAGLTQAQAAKLVHRSLRNWQQWEGYERTIDPAIYELFCLKTGQACDLNGCENDDND